jgi:hypothetical protein
VAASGNSLASSAGRSARRPAATQAGRLDASTSRNHFPDRALVARSSLQILFLVRSAGPFRSVKHGRLRARGTAVRASSLVPCGGSSTATRWPIGGSPPRMPRSKSTDSGDLQSGTTTDVGRNTNGTATGTTSLQRGAQHVNHAFRFCFDSVGSRASTHPRVALKPARAGPKGRRQCTVRSVVECMAGRRDPAPAGQPERAQARPIHEGSEGKSGETCRN